MLRATRSPNWSLAVSHTLNYRELLLSISQLALTAHTVRFMVSCVGVDLPPKSRGPALAGPLEETKGELDSSDC